MKSTFFHLDPSSSTTKYKLKGSSHEYVFAIPLLPAYAIEYYTVQLGGLSALPEPDWRIFGQNFKIQLAYDLDDIESNLIIHFHGIRDYSLLFPSVTNPQLRVRLGEFYREAELAFDSGAWLSFALMCGALFEGILHDRLSSNATFVNLIKQAKASGIIDSAAQKTMNSVRKLRNLVHGNQYARNYVSRVEAMDARVVLDKLLRSK